MRKEALPFVRFDARIYMVIPLTLYDETEFIGR